MIHRITKRDNPFAQIDKRMLGDYRLSWRAKGILSYLLSKPDNWIVRSEEIQSRATEGRDAIRAAMKELAKFGYAELVNTKDGREWLIREQSTKPCPEKPSLQNDNPCPEKPTPEKPTPENRPLVIKRNTNKDLSNKEPSLFDDEVALTQPGKKAIPFTTLIPDSLFSESFVCAWDDFTANRKELKKPLTTRSAKMLLQTLARRPAQAADALALAIKKNWRGFEWEWFDGNGTNGSGSKPGAQIQMMPSIEAQRAAQKKK
jgi:hypothetical protein